MTIEKNNLLFEAFLVKTLKFLHLYIDIITISVILVFLAIIILKIILAMMPGPFKGDKPVVPLPERPDRPYPGPILEPPVHLPGPPMYRPPFKDPGAKAKK